MLNIGGYSYTDNEIPTGLKITMNTPANGFSVGNLATVTISGTLPYHMGISLSRNGGIYLYTTGVNWDSTKPLENVNLVYVWFLSDCTIYNNSSITFSGVDVMAYVNNKYTIAVADGGVYDSIGVQFQTAAETLSTITSSTVKIQPCGSDSVNNHSLESQDSWTIKSLLEASASFDAVNYYTRCDGASTFTLTKVQSSESYYSEFSPLTVGITNPTIEGVVLLPSDMEIPIPNTAEHETLADYGVYTYGNIGKAATTLRVVTPFTDIFIRDFERVAPVDSNFTQLLDRGFGTQFSCKNVKVDEFIIPMTRMHFQSETEEIVGVFYCCHADYTLTSKGLYASVTGSTKLVSDFDYVGTNETQIRNKVGLNHGYGTLMTTLDGVVVVPNRATGGTA